MTAPRRSRTDEPADPRGLALLDWYDRHRRVLPWRALPGQRPDPYHVWLSEIMLQQTTVETVKPYFAKFLALWPDIRALAAADDQAVLSAWAGLGYYARARNLIACARAVAARPGAAFPETEEGLRALPGIGAYTAAAIAAIAFDEPAVVIDGNIERVITRLEAIETPLPRAKAEIADVLRPMVPAGRPGDFAQALMDLGSGICRPRNPDCLLCPFRSNCKAAANGRATAFPVKPARKGKPVRHGTAYLVRDGAGRILLGTRPAKGLLAGMAEVPNTGWAEIAPPDSPPVPADWMRRNAPVIHVFTHFELRLIVAEARLAGEMPPPPGLRWVAQADLAGEPLPTLFRKVIEAV
ncbi:A/G-specific adenine glycosylase [Rhabdaerophilum sp. SD176]|uniref:A/G-specific adenine glycosylase n=1 Tax=Rhabdaerophilum sp. SD176 TaxID=2983548 RepID=UPI0024DFA903|nr:A/G-specific adenine glycosylase [Rhabdaerophilum sp. SD176]